MYYIATATVAIGGAAFCMLADTALELATGLLAVTTGTGATTAGFVTVSDTDIARRPPR